MKDRIDLTDTSRDDYDELIAVWEASVRATHRFLSEEDILFYKDKIYTVYFDAVRLITARDPDRSILGFAGLSEDNLEMLFIRPSETGKGIGRLLTEHVISRYRIKKVSVNEQNDKALGFYLRMGYEIIGRSKTDDTGKPYPLLHLEIP